VSTLVQRTSPARGLERSGARIGSRRWLALGLVAIGLGLAGVALLGPLATGLVDYRVTETLRNQTIGLDAVSLFVVLPLALLAAVLVLRDHVLGFALALGIGAYTSYMFLQYVLGPDYSAHAGNNERLFPLCLVLFGAGWMVALSAWNTIDVDRIPRSRGRDRRIGLVVLPILGVLAFFRYVPALADAMRSTPQEEGYLAGPSFFWAIALLDLGIFLPLTVAACAGLVRETPWAQKALYTVTGWFGLVGPAVGAMAIAMDVNGDPNASAGNTAFMTALGLAFAVLVVVLYRPLIHSRSATP
jgi:hypothetical protein